MGFHNWKLPMTTDQRVASYNEQAVLDRYLVKRYPELVRPIPSAPSSVWRHRAINRLRDWWPLIRELITVLSALKDWFGLIVIG